MASCYRVKEQASFQGTAQGEPLTGEIVELIPERPGTGECVRKNYLALCDFLHFTGANTGRTRAYAPAGTVHHCANGL